MLLPSFFHKYGCKSTKKQGIMSTLPFDLIVFVKWIICPKTQPYCKYLLLANRVSLEALHIPTAKTTVYFWPNLPGCVKDIHRVLKPGGRFAIMVEVVDADSKWTNFVEGMTAYTPEQLKALLDDAGFRQTEIHRKKPMYATILGVKP